MNLRKLPSGEELLAIALRKARKRTVLRRGSRVKKVVEARRIEAIADYVSKRLEQVVKEFPNMDAVPLFYRELVEAIVDLAELRKALGHIGSVAGIVRKLGLEHAVRVKRLSLGERCNSVEVCRQFIGRTASALKSLGESVDVYNSAAERLREVPCIKELPTIIIAGHPNVGKSTLLRRVTKSKPKVARYPFTTQRLELGYFRVKHREFQVIDTPGLLDRPAYKRNAAERKAVAALKHLASLIVFVLDATETCGFSLERQLCLLESIAREFGKNRVAVYLSKRDIAEEKALIEAARRVKNFKLLSWKPSEAKGEIAAILCSGMVK